MNAADLARLELAKRAYKATQASEAEVQTGVRRARLALTRPKRRRNWFSKGLVFVVLAVGSLAGMLERIVGKAFIRFGKPDTMMFSHAFACAHDNLPDLKKSEILMVGDTLETDIIGANTFGLDTALVLSGNTRPEQAAVQIQAKGITPTYLCESVFT